MAAETRQPAERMVAATIGGERRMLRVSDLPLGEEGVAGYAVDVEDMEELGRSFRAFREAQRSMLDQLSSGVAQFDARRQLVFANQPFQRIFALTPAAARIRRRSSVCSISPAMPAGCRKRAISRSGGASGRNGSPPAKPAKMPGRLAMARICGLSPSRCPMAACC